MNTLADIINSLPEEITGDDKAYAAWQIFFVQKGVRKGSFPF